MAIQKRPVDGGWPVDERKESTDSSKHATGHRGQNSPGSPGNGEMHGQGPVWWPGLTKQIREKVRQCEICVKESQNATEPLMTPTRFTQNGGKQDWALAYFAYVYPSVCVCMRACVQVQCVCVSG